MRRCLRLLRNLCMKGLRETEEAMVDADLQASLVDTPLADPSASTVPYEVTPGTEARLD